MYHIPFDKELNVQDEVGSFMLFLVLLMMGFYADILVNFLDIDG